MDLKPIGSEKLQGDEKIKRILEIANFNKVKSKSSNNEFITESENGLGYYGIVKEKDGYYVKKGLTENTLDYIGGMFMKNKNKFTSYSEALKRLELLKGQDLQESVKYVLANKNKPKTEDIPTPEESPIPPADSDVPSSDELPADGVPMDNEPSTDSTPIDNEPEDNETDFLKGIQKLTGKLGQKLRDHEDEIESDDIKYVLNSILSAIDITKLTDEDKEDIMSKLDNSDDDFGDENMGDETQSDNENPNISPEGDEELDELQKLIDTDFDFGDDSNDNEENNPSYTNFIKDDELEEETPIEDNEETTDIKELDIDELSDFMAQNFKTKLSDYFNGK